MKKNNEIENSKNSISISSSINRNRKKALMLASVASMIDQFNISNIEILNSLGYKVDVVADFTNPGTITAERAEDLMKRLVEMNVRVFDISIPRSLNLVAIFSAYRKVKELVNTENYSLLHCHSPIGGVIARQAAKNFRKNGLDVIYTAHGFHFYDGASIMNWLIFYPIEKWFSRYTDVLITINKEDYKRAKQKFHAKKTVYVPGIGVDTEKFKPDENGREKIRAELGINNGQIMFLSVGELSVRKNHKIVVKALNEINDSNIHYIIVGKGALKDELINLDKTGRLKLLGYRTDIVDLLHAADLFVFPSLQEGLPVALMEAMAAGLPCICSKIRGNADLIKDTWGMFNPLSLYETRKAIERFLENKHVADISEVNMNTIKSFNIKTVRLEMRKIYSNL